MYLILEQFRNSNLDVVCMQDACQLPYDSIAHLGNNLFWTGQKEEKTTWSWNYYKQSLDIVIDKISYTSQKD